MRSLRSRLAYKVLGLFLSVFLLQSLLILGSFLSFYNIQKSTAIKTNMLLLQQANDNYLSNVLYQIDRGIIQAYYNKLFWEEKDTWEDTHGADVYEALTATYLLNDEIESVYLYTSSIDRLYVMDRASYANLPIYRSTNNNAYLADYDETTAAWIASAKNDRGNLVITQISSLNQSNSEGHQMLSFARALFDPLRSDKLRFVLSVNVNMSFFRQLADEVLNDGEGMLILTDKGQHIFSTMKGDNALDIAAAASCMQADKEQAIRMNDREYLLLCNQSSTTGWKMVKLLPKQALHAEATKTLLSNISSMAVIFMLSCVLLTFMIRQIVCPINELSEVMDCYELRQTIRPAYTNRIDEVGKLYCSFVKMHNHIDQLITQEYDTQIREKQARLEALQAQINPHFFNNTLQTIAGIAMERDVIEIEQIVSALSTILRYSLSKSRKLVTIHEEISIVEDYMFVQRFRFGERIDLKIEISKDTLNCLIPVLTLQLAVENAVKHGVEIKTGQCFIRIYDQTLPNGDIELSIEDNGIGVDADQMEKLRQSLRNQEAGGMGWNGNGLINMNERIRCFWGDDYGLTLDASSLGGFIVRMHIPRTFDERVDDDE